MGELENPFIPKGFTEQQIKEAFSNISEFEDGIIHPFREDEDRRFQKSVVQMESNIRPFKS